MLCLDRHRDPEPNKFAFHSTLSEYVSHGLSGQNVSLRCPRKLWCILGCDEGASESMSSTPWQSVTDPLRLSRCIDLDIDSQLREERPLISMETCDDEYALTTLR